MRSLALAIGLVALTAAACGDDEATAPPRAVAPAITPFPTVTFGPVQAGVEYTTRRFKPAITITLPPGEWLASTADTPDHIELENETTPPVTDAELSFHHVTKVFDAEQGGEVPGDAIAAPPDFAAWLVAHPHLDATEPKPVELMGLKGVSIDVRAKSSQPRQYRDCGKYEGPCVVLMQGGVEPLVYGGDVAGRFFVLEQPDGGQLVVQEFVEPASAFDEQVKLFDAALASARVGPG